MTDKEEIPVQRVKPGGFKGSQDPKPAAEPDATDEPAKPATKSTTKPRNQRS